MFDFFSLLVAIVALIVARKTFNQIAVLRARLDAFESAAVQPRAAVSPPPLAPDRKPIKISQHRRQKSQPRNRRRWSKLNRSRLYATAPTPQPADEAGSAAPAPPPLPQPVATPSFEERVGTRWVVWVRGLTLALGGLFMVRYSIEAGLVGPGVRVLLGGAFALALLAAGEWTRRKESVSTIEALPMRQHSGDPHRRRHVRRVRDRLCGLCAV